MKKERLYCAFAYNIHDSSVTFSLDNRVVLVLEAERIFRQKRKRCDKNEMEYLIEYGLHHLGKQPDDVDGWAMTTLQNPLLWDRGISIFDANTKKPKEPYWDKFNILGKERNIYMVNHHLAHAASYLLSDFNNALIVTCDGGGDYDEISNRPECVAIFEGEKNHIKRLDLVTDEYINGKFYGACSYFIYKNIHCEGKMMALASFGTPQQDTIDKLGEISKQLCSFEYKDGIELLEKTFPDITHTDKGIFLKDKLDFAASVQKLFSQKRVQDIASIIKKTKSHTKYLVLAGGVSLNLDTNTEILNAFPNMEHFIAPCCDDTGQSLGALSILIVTETGLRPEVKIPYLGMGKETISYNNEVIPKVLDVLNRNGIIIVHNGKAEIGPRALGNRSLISRADKISVKKKLSEEIKQRESYRPVAPITIEEKVNDYFTGPRSSPFMLYKYEVIESNKAKLEGAVHYDGSARVQTVTKESNPFLYDLLKAYGDKTGIYVLLNTSLNLKGDAIANTLEDSMKIYSEIKGPKALIYDGNIEKLDT